MIQFVNSYKRDLVTSSNKDVYPMVKWKSNERKFNALTVLVAGSRNLFLSSLP